MQLILTSLFVLIAALYVINQYLPLSLKQRFMRRLGWTLPKKTGCKSCSNCNQCGDGKI